MRVRDIAYQRWHGQPLLARVYQPAGVGAFAVVLDVHGGDWTSGDRLQQELLDRALAANGVLVVAIDTRQPPLAGYPASVQDVNFATRWLKLHAAELGAADGAPVGAMGSSSGGHLVILSGMCPRDARYASLPLEPGSALDASLAFVIADAPVTDPASYLDSYPQPHAYWTSREAAVEGNPTRLLDRREAAELPPLLIIQGSLDEVVPLSMTRAFSDRYRAAGGQVCLRVFEGLGHAFILAEPRRIESARQAAAVLAFIREHAAPQTRR